MFRYFRFLCFFSDGRHGSWRECHDMIVDRDPAVAAWQALVATNIYLVGGLVAILFIFPEILGISNHLNWRTHIFQRGGPTTDQLLTHSATNPLGRRPVLNMESIVLPYKQWLGLKEKKIQEPVCRFYMGETQWDSKPGQTGQKWCSRIFCPSAKKVDQLDHICATHGRHGFPHQFPAKLQQVAAEALSPVTATPMGHMKISSSSWGNPNSWMVFVNGKILSFEMDDN